MIGEELDAAYTDDGSSTLNNEGDNYSSELEYDEEDDYFRYRKEMVFAETEFNKSKTKVGCTIG
jgi:hypothetical protein